MLTESVKEYYSLTKKNEVREAAKKLRRKFLRYKDAEIVYSMSHKMLLEHASKAGAIYRMEGTVLINEGADYYGLGLKMFTRLAHEAGAVYKIGGKMVRIKRSIFEAYLRKIQADI